MLTPVISNSRASVLWSSQKFFFIRNTLSGAMDLFVSVGVLIAVLKFKEKTIRNGINNNRHCTSKYWSFFIDVSALFINWSTIPLKSLNKQNLPQSAEEMASLLQENNAITFEQFKSVTAKQIKSQLENVYRHHYARYLKFYSQYGDLKQKRRFAQSHALIEEVIKMKSEKWNRAMIYQAYWQIIVDDIAQGNDPVLQLESAHYFWQKISKAQESRPENVLVHGAKGVAREYRVKLTGPIRAHIKNKLRIQHMTYPAIVRSVKKKFGVTIDVSSVKKFKHRDKELKNLVEYDSNGVGYSRINSMPRLQRELASSPGEQYIGDFYDVMFYVRTSSGEVVTLVAFVVIDTFSRKIVGWSLIRKDAKNREQAAIQAFRMAFVETCWMPQEILLDRDPYYKSRAFKSFKRKVMNAGVEFPPCPPGFATFRAEMEAVLGAFQLKVCSDKPFFKGADSRSRRHFKTGNPSQEFLNQLWLHRDEFPEIGDFNKQFGEMVIQFNTNFYESAA